MNKLREIVTKVNRRCVVFSTFLLIIIVAVINWCVPQKYFVFENANSKPDKILTDIQLRQFETTDAVLSVAVGNVINRRSNTLNFFIFSPNDFKTFRVADFEIKYDGKTRKIKKDITYNVNRGEPNFEKKISLDFNGEKIYCFQKNVVPGFLDFKYCWINFYNMFKWEYAKVGKSFEMEMQIHYFLDEREYKQDISYTVICDSLEKHPPF